MEFNDRELTVANVVKFIKRRNHVSMAEIENRFRGTTGNYDWGTGILALNNIWFWVGMSERFCDVMSEIKKIAEIQPYPASPLVYLYDGLIPKYPVAKDFKRKYREPRWVPIVLSYTNPVGEREQK